MSTAFAYGLVVERETPVEDARMLPQRRLVGRVGSIADGKARLSERFMNVEGLLPLDELYLEASPENTRHLLQHFTRNASGRAQGKIDEIVFENSRGRSRMEHIARISDWVRGLGGIELQEGLSVSIGSLINEARLFHVSRKAAHRPTCSMPARSSQRRARR